MADAFKCDRCGRYYVSESRKIKEVTYESWSGSAYKDYDLCEECMTDFYEFIKGVPPRTLAEKLRALLNNGG